MHPHANISGGRRRDALQRWIDCPDDRPSIPTGTGELERAFTAQTEPGQRKLCRITAMLVDGVRNECIDPFCIVGFPATHPAKLRANHQKTSHEWRSVLCVPAG